MLSFRRYEKLYYNLVVEDLDGIYKRTGCLKPCNYIKYWIVGDRLPTSYKSENFLFSLNAMSNDTFVETELLVYPWTSLVAEFGGSLSLFLGISFMSLWEGVYVFREGLHRICEIVSKTYVKTASPTVETSFTHIWSKIEIDKHGTSDNKTDDLKIFPEYYFTEEHLFLSL